MNQIKKNWLYKVLNIKRVWYHITAMVHQIRMCAAITDMHFKPLVAGSSPAGAIGSVAQSVEQRIQPTHSELPK